MLLNLDDLEGSISNALENGAALVYWNHQLMGFNYMKVEDQANYHKELKNLRRGKRDGKVGTVQAGECITVNGVSLFVLEMELRSLPCQPYFLLRRRGLSTDIMYTPYLFKSEASRDSAMKFILG